MSAEDAIRQYLLFLEDPSKLRDEGLIKRLESAVVSAKDPIDKLKAAAELERAQSIDGAQYRAGFVRHAKAWADQNSVSAAAFASLGVPAEDLRAAGLLGGRGRPRSSSGGRRSRVTIEDIVARMPAGAFTVKQLEDVSGASSGTVRKAIAVSLSNGVITAAGTDPDHGSRGKAPTLYRKS